MKAQKFIHAVLVVLIAVGVSNVLAKDSMAPDSVVPLWEGKAPGSESAAYREQKTRLPGGDEEFTRNVVEPSLSIYLPAPENSTGTGIVIAPGGGFRMLSMETEGHALARWLRDRGIAAFVLKYRLVETPVNDNEFFQFMLSARERLTSGASPATKLDTDGKLGFADGLRAMELVFKNAEHWGLNEAQIGIIGFSAGASVASHAALYSPAESRPRFVAPIYGAPFSELPKIDPAMPPVFIAHSSNDAPFLLRRIDAFYEALKNAGFHPERHVYRDGGHGYGVKIQGASSDFWVHDFYNWLASLSLTGDLGVPETLSKQRIRHTVAFSLKHDRESAQERNFLDALATLAHIPGVEAFEVLRQVGSKNQFTFGVSMEFASQAAYDSYNEHPDHVRFVNERWLREVEDFMEIDYQARN